MRITGFVLADEDVSAPGPSMETGAIVPGNSGGLAACVVVSDPCLEGSLGILAVGVVGELVYGRMRSVSRRPFLRWGVAPQPRGGFSGAWGRAPWRILYPPLCQTTWVLGRASVRNLS